MNKTLMIAALSLLICNSSEAQTSKTVKTQQTVKRTATTVKKHTWHKKEPVQQDFAVCRNNYGYYICNETPDHGNSTHSRIVIKEEHHMPPVSNHSTRRVLPKQDNQQDMIAPAPQSYPENTNTVSGICDYPYSRSHGIEISN